MPVRLAISMGDPSGIGAEVARQLARGGCRVALVARREPELARVASDIDAATGAPLWVYVTQGPIRHSAAVAGSTVIVSSYDG